MILDFAVFVAGALVGSFLNVLAYRYNTGSAFFKGRSFCFSCGTTLSWQELVPVVSYLVQKARCKTCKSKIPPDYVLGELVTGVLFLLTYLHFGFSVNALFLLLIGCIFIVIALYDFRHQIVPDGLVYTASFLALTYVILQIGPTFTALGTGRFLAGPLFFGVFALLWLVSRGTWMGFGDAKLVLAIGWVLGISQGFASLLLAFWIGAIVGVLLLLLNRRKFSLKHEIPFAPFLIVAYFIVLFADLSLASFIL